MKPETSLVNSCLQYLKAVGVQAWRTNTGGSSRQRPDGSTYYIKFNVKGTPDIFGIIPPRGQFLAIECKVGKNKLTDEQLQWLESAAAAGAKTYVIRNIDELIELFKPDGEGWS